MTGEVKFKNLPSFDMALEQKRYDFWEVKKHF